MASSSSQNVNPLFMTIAEKEAEFKKMLVTLGAAGIPVHTYGYGDMLMMGYDLKSFRNMIRPFLSLPDIDSIFIVLTLLIQNQIIGPKEKMTLRELVRAASWLKGTAGREALANLQHQKKLQKKSHGEMSAEEASLCNAFQQQLIDMSESNKMLRVGYEERITELKRQINAIRRERDVALEQNKARFAPSSAYPVTDEPAVVRESWKLYLDDCLANSLAPLEATEEHMAAAREKFGPIVIARHAKDFVGRPEIRAGLVEYCRLKVLHLDSVNEDKRASYFVASWKSLVEQFLLAQPLPLRSRLLELVPVGSPTLMGLSNNLPLKLCLHNPQLWKSRQKATKMPPPISRLVETAGEDAGPLGQNGRILVVSPLAAKRGGAIPVSRSKFEAGVRKIIGGGELRGWREASSMYRGGGCYSDALRLLAGAVEEPPGMTLPGFFGIPAARDALRLPSGLTVPDGPQCVDVHNFNNDATAGPFLRAFGIKTKAGLRDELRRFMWKCYDDYACGRTDEKSLPYLCARVGYRTKLVTMKKAFENWTSYKPIGRAVMMLDALEQFSSSPLYNVLSKICSDRRLEKGFGFKNTIVRASSDWMIVWEDFSRASAVVELDWKKFDRERPSEDIGFMIDVILSCFEAKTPREERLLRAYGIMLRRALVERPLVTDEGGAFFIDGMVPSGSLWTGWLDTALNILYITSVCRYLGMPQSRWAPMCAGDDNLTIFYGDFKKEHLLAIREYLNNWYRAGIEEEDFFIHYPPFHVTKEQACFPPGTDLKLGTSKILSDATWVPFEGRCPIDQAAGRSHRWQYVFRGKPKFLSCYWLPNGMPIRPSSDNLEKLLFPEGIHGDIDDYIQAVVSMLVDNPFNAHNVNHLMHRFCIAHQLKRIAATGIKVEHAMYMSRFRCPGGDGVPFPEIACWRRMDGYKPLEEVPFVAIWLEDFKAFCDGVMSLYARASTGGIDAWKFSSILRGESDLGEGQFGSDIDDWCRWLGQNPLTKYLRPIKRFQGRPGEREATEACLRQFHESSERMTQLFGTTVMSSAHDYVIWLCKIIKGKYLSL
nr:ORF1+2P [Lily amalgavirus 2]